MVELISRCRHLTPQSNVSYPSLVCLWVRRFFLKKIEKKRRTLGNFILLYSMAGAATTHLGNELDGGGAVEERHAAPVCKFKRRWVPAVSESQQTHTFAYITMQAGDDETLFPPLLELEYQHVATTADDATITDAEVALARYFEVEEGRLLVKGKRCLQVNAGDLHPPAFFSNLSRSLVCLP